MRISDWSSDVCSSDLELNDLLGRALAGVRHRGADDELAVPGERAGAGIDRAVAKRRIAQPVPEVLERLVQASAELRLVRLGRLVRVFGAAGGLVIVMMVPRYGTVLCWEVVWWSG